MTTGPGIFSLLGTAFVGGAGVGGGPNKIELLSGSHVTNFYLSCSLNIHCYDRQLSDADPDPIFNSTTYGNVLVEENF
jgi:hypothetical protein